MPSKKIVKKKPPSKADAVQTALRYLNNAKETLSKSPIEDNRYQDEKYVREASGIAYLAGLIAIEGWLVERSLWTEKHTRSIEGYKEVIHKHPQFKHLNNYLNIVYEDLHLFGYYAGATGTAVIKEGLQNVKNIIELIRKN
ncbi:MAG: DUF5618 family protein [Leptospiraceae bacterium]|nr:DUF5618 family protein [Leptospiraceae bacterium]MCP5497935.1 DUF5618 family protein [Leptospiraceae bacterium]